MSDCVLCGRPCIKEGEEVWCHPCAKKEIKRLEAEADETRQAQPTIHRVGNPSDGGPTVVWTNCAGCGKGVAVDEDGCCIGCGRDAIWWGHCVDLAQADYRIGELEADIVRRDVKIEDLYERRAWWVEKAKGLEQRIEELEAEQRETGGGK